MKDGFCFTEKYHRVVVDHTSSGHARLTCQTCDGDTLVRQPYMTTEQWQHEGQAFEAVHGKLKLESFVPNDSARAVCSDI